MGLLNGSRLLAAYRDFITGTNLHQFFRFQVSYADYVVKRLADSKAKPPRLFSLNGLNLMVKNFNHRKDDQEWYLTEITEDPGFLRIAKAINSATVYAGKDEHGWERMYGLIRNRVYLRGFQSLLPRKGTETIMRSPPIPLSSQVSKAYYPARGLKLTRR